MGFDCSGKIRGEEIESKERTWAVRSGGRHRDSFPSVRVESRRSSKGQGRAHPNMKETMGVTFQQELVTDEISAKEIVWDDLSMMDVLDALENRQGQPHNDDNEKKDPIPVQQPIDLKPTFSSLYFDAVEDDDGDNNEDGESVSIAMDEINTSLSSEDSSIDSFQSSVEVELKEPPAPVKVLHFRKDDASECSTLAPSVVSNMTTLCTSTTVTAVEAPTVSPQEKDTSLLEVEVNKAALQTPKEDPLETEIAVDIPKSATKDDLLCAIKALGEKLRDKSNPTAKPLEPEGQVLAESGNNSVAPEEVQSDVENCSEFREPAAIVDGCDDNDNEKAPSVVEKLLESPWDEALASEVVSPEEIKEELLPEIIRPPIDFKEEESADDIYARIEGADSMGDNSLILLPTVPDDGVCGENADPWTYLYEKTGGATCSIPLHPSLQELLGKGEKEALKLLNRMTTTPTCGENPGVDTFKFLFDPKDQLGPILPSNIPCATEWTVQPEKDEEQKREDIIHKAFQKPSTMAKLRLGARGQSISRRKWDSGASTVSKRSRRAPKDNTNKHLYDEMREAMSVRLSGNVNHSSESDIAPEKKYAEEESSIVGLYEVERTTYPNKLLTEKDQENLKTFQIIQSEILEREGTPDVLIGTAVVQIQSSVSSETENSANDSSIASKTAKQNNNDASIELVMNSPEIQSTSEWKILVESGESIHERAIKLKATCVKEIQSVLRDAQRCLKEEGLLVERIKPPEYEEFGYEDKTESEMVVERVLEWIDCDEPEIQSKYIPSPLTENNRSRAMLQTIPWRQELFISGIILFQANFRRRVAQKESDKLRHAKYFFRQHWRGALRRSTERTRELRLQQNDGKPNHAALAQKSFLAHREKRARLWHAIEKHRHWRYMNKTVFDELYDRVDEREELQQNREAVLQQIYKRLDFLVAHAEQKCFMVKGQFKFFAPIDKPDPQLRAKKDECFQELLPYAQKRIQSHIHKRQLLQQFQEFLHQQELQVQKKERENQLAYKLVQGFQSFVGNFQFGADTAVLESFITDTKQEPSVEQFDMPSIPNSEH